jgi:SAM-dependent methyltransferase
MGQSIEKGSFTRERRMGRGATGLLACTVSDFSSRLWKAISKRWREESASTNGMSASIGILRELWRYVRDSTPERRRRRYGDMEYDWEYRVNTTSGAVGWRERLLGAFYSPYQPTDAGLFREMMASLPIDFSQFTFVDLGSGKGRTLLLASEYPFRRIVGVEVLPELHRIAEQNIGLYGRATQVCTRIESVCADAREFELPDEPLVLYLFNPLPVAGLILVLDKLEKSLERKPRAVVVLYHNAVLEDCLRERSWLDRVAISDQFAAYRNQNP